MVSPPLSGVCHIVRGFRYGRSRPDGDVVARAIRRRSGRRGVSGEVRLGVCADVETNGVVASFGEGMPMGYGESSAQPMAKAVSRVTRVSGMPKRMKVADE